MPDGQQDDLDDDHDHGDGEVGAQADQADPAGAGDGGRGARLMTTMVHHMRDNGIRYGLQTMCEGGGQANATILELL